MAKRKKKRGSHGKVPRSLRRLFPNVDEVIDATRTVRVTVFQRDCSEGKKMQPSECALAKATKRQYHADGAVIGLTSSYIIRGKKALRFATPESVAREVVSFDRHSDFAPGEYHLAPKPPSSRLGIGPSNTRSGSRSVKRITHTSVRVRELERGSS